MSPLGRNWILCPVMKMKYLAPKAREAILNENALSSGYYTFQKIWLSEF